MNDDFSAETILSLTRTDFRFGILTIEFAFKLTKESGSQRLSRPIRYVNEPSLISVMLLVIIRLLREFALCSAWLSNAMFSGIIRCSSDADENEHLPMVLVFECNFSTFVEYDTATNFSNVES